MMARRATKANALGETKVPNPIDRHVGSRVRMRRLMLDMSQEKLAQGLGLTFQQVQKYEKGANRIGASRLQQISMILDAPVSFFFDEAPGLQTKAGSIREASFPAHVSEFLSMADGLALTKAFVRIKDKRSRQRIVFLVEAISNIPRK